MLKIRVSLFVILALLLFTNVVSAKTPAPKAFVAVLSGRNEVPARDTRALGVAGFQLKSGGSGLDYALVVAKIKNVTAAHIHCAPAGVNGPIGVTLYHGTPASGPAEGLIASGRITTPDAANGCGWTSVGDVVAALRSGNAYVNVHTNDGVDPANTGPGDFPGGEIRGQVFAVDTGK